MWLTYWITPKKHIEMHFCHFVIMTHCVENSYWRDNILIYCIFVWSGTEVTQMPFIQLCSTDWADLYKMQSHHLARNGSDKNKWKKTMHVISPTMTLWPFLMSPCSVTQTLISSLIKSCGNPPATGSTETYCEWAVGIPAPEQVQTCFIII